MGLDMYLEKEVYVGDALKDTIGDINVKVGEENIRVNFSKVSNIIEGVAYWRKANQIHNWFVKNVQDGEDDCKRYFVTGSTLLELVELCKRVLADHSLADKLLPTQGGFFFGGTDYDEYYFRDLEDTISQLIDVKEDSYYYYSSSW